MAKRGTTQTTARRFVSDSMQDRRGPQNPNRQRQPSRLGMAERLMSGMKRMIGKSIKGPDLGTG